MKIEIIEVNKSIIVEPNVIYNRFDLMYQNNQFIECITKNEKYIIPFYREKRKIYLGLYLRKLPDDVFNSIVEYCFKKYKANRIFIENSFNSLKDKPSISGHYRIELPENSEDLLNRLTSKGRYNLKREKRMLNDLGKIIFEHYDREKVPKEYIQKFFEFKKNTHNRNFHLSESSYLEKYYITDIYIMKLDDKVISVLFSCEQCENVYLENLSYDSDYSKYSAGFILYEHFLEELISKNRKSVFLGGGKLDYKKRFGSIYDNVRTGYIYKNDFYRLVYGLIHKILMKL